MRISLLSGLFFTLICQKGTFAEGLDKEDYGVRGAL